ncbi:hypothetical protein [Nitrospira sp. Kam-Ns4a]
MTDLERVESIKVFGVQRGLKGGTFILCLDPETGTTFAIRPGETIGAALGRVKARFQTVMGEGRGGTHGAPR